MPTRLIWVGKVFFKNAKLAQDWCAISVVI